MSDIEIIESKPAPYFELTDSEGRKVRLSSYKGNKHIILIFNRGFV
jgi:peroxiredoxin